MLKLKKRIQSTLLAGTLVLALIIVGASTQPNRYFEIARNLDIFTTIYKEANAFYVDEINPSKLINVGIEQMLATLDPYTVYISEDKIEDYKTLNTGQYGGVGAVTVRIDDQLFISMIHEGSVANTEGLQIGDEVLTVDGVDVRKLSDEEIGKLVKGQVKSIMNITVNRLGEDKPLAFTLKREKITIPNVPYFGMVGEDIGYIKFTEFSTDGSVNIRKAMNALRKDGAKKLILDVRDNPGGFLIEAVNISNLFIPRGLEVVRTIGKVEENNNVFKTLNQPLSEDIPLAVLINSGSASASEIVAGTLQDYDRAVIVGQKSYGKGLVQTTRPLSYNAQLRLTIAKYYIPSGRCIQAIDYAHRNPDGSVGRVPDSLKVAFKTQNGRTVYDGGGIDPDVVTEAVATPAVAYKLISEGLIFKYANEYKLTHKSIDEARSFELTDEEYDEFIAWVSDRGLEFSHDIDDYISQIKTNADIDQKIDDIEPILKRIQARIDLPTSAYLKKYKTSIRFLLEAEIAARYYLQKGVIEAGLGNDSTFAKAVELLSNPAEYYELLN
jgi:carboxyl-terminal processing protease